MVGREGGRAGADAAYTADRQGDGRLATPEMCRAAMQMAKTTKAQSKPGSAPPASGLITGGVFAVTHKTCVHGTD